MGRRESLDAGGFQPLWAAGWQWQWIVAGSLFLGGYLVVEFGDLLQGFGVVAAGVALAAVGVRYVDGRSDAVLEAGVEQAQSLVLDVIDRGDDCDLSSVLSRGRPLLFVAPAREYAVTTLVVGPDALFVHDDASVSLAHRYVSVGDDVRSYEYRSLSSVSYEDGALRLTARDGSTDSFALAEEPTSALSAVRDRLVAAERRD